MLLSSLPISQRGQLSLVSFAAVQAVFPLGIHAVFDAASRTACLERAEDEILRAPEKNELHVTTSRQFKRDLTEFFCAMPLERLAAMTALEIGIFRGHTTAVLAAIFGKVIAIDVDSRYLQAASQHCSRSPSGVDRGVVFLAVDSFADDWKVLSSNRIHVAFIDGDHRYDRVASDANRALGLLEPVDFLIFDDYGVEEGVRKVIGDLLKSGALKDCLPVGRGSDGDPWLLRGWSWVNHTEGMLCMRGPQVLETHASSDFQDSGFLVYASPLDHLLRASSIWNFQSSGTVWTDRWGKGTWRWPVRTGARSAVVADAQRARDILHVELPGLEPSEWEVLFNRPRTAFLLTDLHKPSSAAAWFGLRSNRVNQVFEVANEQFELRNYGL
eukprot:TRINITY_DN49293_c0_g1_i1.p1 TRINITY_DN49293_c0_g1~~TRINITY_DN49293_c0_g1_i1.p1  ORF type:complete len:385 (+),score=50.14 TRINITY_DN49293_c0_g1_i1:102-1256(+)